MNDENLTEIDKFKDLYNDFLFKITINDLANHTDFDIVGYDVMHVIDRKINWIFIIHTALNWFFNKFL